MSGHTNAEPEGYVGDVREEKNDDDSDDDDDDDDNADEKDGGDSEDASEHEFPPREAWLDLARHDEIDDLYRCVVCRESRPRVDLTACEHVLCFACVPKLAVAACPECRRPLGSSSMLGTARSTWTKESRIVSNIVGNQKLWCTQGPPPPPPPPPSSLSSLRASLSSRSLPKLLSSTPPPPSSSPASSSSSLLSSAPLRLATLPSGKTPAEDAEAEKVRDDAEACAKRDPRGHLVEYRNWATHRTAQCEFRRVPCGACDKRVICTDLDAHRRARCVGRLVACEHGCGDKVRRDMRRQHVVWCLFVKKPCVNAGCDATPMRYESHSHERVCAFSRVPCMMHEAGCAYVDERRHHAAHIEAGFVAHMTMLMLRVAQSPHWSVREHWREFAAAMSRGNEAPPVPVSAPRLSAESAPVTAPVLLAAPVPRTATKPTDRKESKLTHGTSDAALAFDSPSVARGFSVESPSVTSPSSSLPSPSSSSSSSSLDPLGVAAEPKRTTDPRIASRHVRQIGDAPVLAASSIDGEWYTARVGPARYGSDGDDRVHIHFIGWSDGDDEEITCSRLRPIFASDLAHSAFLASLRVGTRVDVRQPSGWCEASVMSRSDLGMLLDCDGDGGDGYLVPTDEYERRLVPAGFAAHLDNIF
jgi:hypothetical protein